MMDEQQRAEMLRPPQVAAFLAKVEVFAETLAGMEAGQPETVAILSALASSPGLARLYEAAVLGTDLWAGEIIGRRA